MSIGRITRFLEKEMCTNEKANQTFLQHLPLPLWQVVKSFELVVVLGLYIKSKIWSAQLSYF